MPAGIRISVAVLAAALISVPGVQTAVSQSRETRTRPDFDIRDTREPARARVAVDPSDRSVGGRRPVRVNRESGAVRLLERPGFTVAPGGAPAAIRVLLAGRARQLGLEPRDLSTLVLIRDYTSRSNGVRHLVFRQVVDGIAVFDSSVAVHVQPDGTVARLTSNAAPTDDRDATPGISSAAARIEAVSHAGEEDAGPAALTWLPIDGTLRLAWHVVVTAAERADVYDILIDAQNGELLLRRNRARDAQGSGRVLQSASPVDPRLPDAMPSGGGGTACPPPANHVLRSLNGQFRDPATVLGSTGRLEGNNTRIFRGNAATQSALGTFDGGSWLFDFPFNSAGSAETFLFFALNYAHDFFYDLGFDEAAGNFQADNFGRGGLGGDPLRANARAPGRNNANYVHALDGTSPTINMFLWDGVGCWAEDVDTDGVPDLDGDYDLDIILHEYHHGVSMRLNTAWTGNEAGAIGEGGGDFFAYTINGDTVLAEYARAGGLRRINGKHYGDWTCLLGLICEVHDNGEIWGNALWEVRERFRTDVVRGSEAAAINESHQIYVDGLTFSPPAPTMLDMRDAMLAADALRNPGTPESQHFCRLWESFAARGMGVSATDTSDNGLNRVGPAYDVPDGCHAPPAPPAVTVTASAPTASEAGLVAGALTFNRVGSDDSPLTVQYVVAGTAASGTDYTPLQGSAIIPQGASAVSVAVTPIDDTVVENSETVTVTVIVGSGYVVGTPSSATVSIVSDDVAPDMVVTALSAPRAAAAGGSLDVTDTTRNQGLGSAPASETSFHLSKNAILDAADPLLGSRTAAALEPGAATTSQTSLVLPAALNAGTYYLFAKADAPGAIAESNEYNNTRITTVAIGPDLAVTGVSAPGLAAAGASVIVSDTTSNQGLGTAPASSTRFFLSSNVFLEAGDAALQARSVPSLPSGATSIGSTTITIPAGTPTGTYYLFAQADAGGDVAEANENNNARSALIRIGPDLTVSSLTAPTRAAAGGAINVTDTTRNVGAGPAPGSSTTFFLSANFVLDAMDIRLGPSRQVPPLAANEMSTGTTALTLPNVAPGAWIIVAKADEANAVGETQETNNTRFAMVQVGPDLSFLSVTAPSSGVSGGAITVSATVRNTGGGAAAASIVRFYLSSNVTLDAADLQLDAVRDVPALAPDATHAGTTSVPLPAGTTGGRYLLIVADGGQAVAESNELNNVAARFIQISGG